MLGPIIDCGQVKVDDDNLVVRLRPTEERDLGNCLRWINDPEINRYMGIGTFGYCLQTEREWYERVVRDDNDIQWSVVLMDEDHEKYHVGQTGLHRISWVDGQATSGIVLDSGFWGKSIASRVMKARTRYAFDELRLEVVYTKVFAPNMASRKGLEKAGYVHYGTEPKARRYRGEYLDAWLGAITRERYVQLKAEGYYD